MVENRGPELRAVCVTFVSMAFVATALRVYVRLRIVRSFGWDDAWMVCATLAHIMFAVCAIAGVHYGTGRHFEDLTEEGIYKALRYWWLCYIAYCLSMIAAKISISLFLLRITILKLQRRIIYTVMCLSVFTGIVFFLVTLFQCKPVSYFWNRNQPGKCVNVYVIIGLTYFYSVINAICDFTFGLMPVWLVWGLNMRRSEKLALIPIMSMACVASTAVVVRMAYVMDFRSSEFLYDTVDIAIWSDTEQGLAITAASLATLRPLYRAIVKRLGLSKHSTNRISTNPLQEGKETPYTPSGFSSGQNRKKRSGPFSLMTFTRNDGAEEEEYGLENCKPVKLRDDLVGHGNAQGRPKSEEGFTSWRIQVGEGSEEELNNIGGITRHTDVYMSSEVDRRKM
ncbi:hypothetical protein K505DRAFT_380377, partial [Melanomma pulvis-pyrius CBS 109.77]